MIAKLLNKPDFGLLLFRLFVGLSMAFAHGLGKVPPSEKFLAGVEQLGFPFPVVFAWAAGLSELVGGIFIALGLWIRPSALFLGFTMAVAAFGRHGTDPYNMKELSLFYFFACLLFVLTGAGKYSLDQRKR